jgi:hypothetical protein
MEAHVAGCADCREALDDLELNRLMLQELPVPSMEPVRQPVLARVRRRRMLAWAAPIAAAAMLALGVGLVRTGRIDQKIDQPVNRAAVEPATPAARSMETAIASAHPGRPAEVVTRMRRPGGKAVARTGQETLVVQIVTDDPDVVVYWLIDSKGEME